MPSLWQTTWRRWLESRSLRGVDHLCDHLRRDIGLTNVDRMDAVRERPGQPIRDRILSSDRTVFLLHESR